MKTFGQWGNSCRGKIRYSSRKRALAKIRSIQRGDTHEAPELLDAYRCAECACWHIGHRTKRRAVPPLKRMRAAAGDIVEITWRKPDGTEARSWHEAPRE